MFDELAGEQRSLREKLETFFTRPSNPKNMKVLGLMIIFCLSIFGVVALAGSPAFHSRQVIGPVARNDPFNIIYNPNGASTSFNHVGGSFYAISANCGVQGRPCEFVGSNLAPNNVTTSVALSKNSIGQLSIVSGKHLFLYFEYEFLGNIANCCSWTDFGWYLTTNGTIPTHALGSSAFYQPRDDPSVTMLMDVQPSGGGNGNYLFFMQRETTTKQSISQQDLGQCNPAGSAFACSTNSLGLTVNTVNHMDAFTLNYTGGSSGISQITTGPNSAIVVTTSTNFPWFNLNTGPLYLGLFMTPKSNANDLSAVEFDYGSVVSNVPSIPTLQIGGVTYTQQQVTVLPQIDTSGFFGPIIRWFISAGVYIAQNIINFLSFLSGILWPTLVAVFTQLANALKIVLNALGSFFGIGAIGDDMYFFFNGIVNFLSNIVVAAFAQILNLVNLFVQLLTWLGSIFGGPVWSGIIGIATLIAGGWATITTAYGFLTQLSTNGLLGINYYFLMDWVFGMFMLSVKGMDGFKAWIDLNGLVFSKIALAMFFFVKESIQALVWIKQIVVNWV